jgi:hypothetical protein
MPVDRVPTDLVVDDLVDVYRLGIRRLEGLVSAALRRGLDASRVGGPGQRRGDASLAYRERQLRAAKAIVAELDRAGRDAAITATANAYGSAILALDRTLGATPDATAAARFGGIHRGAVDALAGNLNRSLAAAAAQVGQSLDIVFARAATLAGPLGPDGLAGLGFIGRRADDPWRRAALEQIGAGTVALQTRRQISRELADRLLRDGVTDALTGYVDRAGRRWPLEVYVDMVARTTTREATSRATVNRLAEHGLELVTVTSHPHIEDACTPYDGKTFALPGSAPRAGVEVLDRMPPFHPRCKHVLGPAGANLDEYERELGIAAEDLAGKTPAAPAGLADDLLPAPRPPAPPLGGRARPSHDDGTRERLEAQRVNALVDGDPGPEPGAREAWEAAVELEGKRAVRVLNTTLGPGLKAELGKAWAKRINAREQLLNGDMTIDEFEELAIEEFERLEYGRARREFLSRELRSRQINCFVCGRFKKRPADICDYCGDDPVTVGGDAHSFNRNFGYSD